MSGRPASRRDRRQWAVWWEAARPRTLPAALTPVIVGTAAAARPAVWRFAAALVVALAMQVGVNYANDYFDGVRGVDTSARVGPRRAVAAGLVAPERMRRAMLAAFVVAAVAGALLAAATTWWLLGVGAVCFAAAVGYSGGRRPYASRGLGEVFVFVFFGLVATLGTAYVQGERITVEAAAASVPVGLLATAILLANNLRDLPTDRAAGKRTLAVLLGDRASRLLFLVLTAAAFALLALVAAVARQPWPLLGVLAAPVAIAPVRAVQGGATGADLVPVLARSALVQLTVGVLLALGLLLPRVT